MNHPSTTCKVILVDDHIVLRDALATLINAYSGFQVLAMAANGIELMAVLKEGKIPDVLVLDLNMPGMDGYETSIWLAKHHPEIKILVLTMYDSETALLRLLHEGVRGFLKKDIHPNELQNAIAAVQREGYYYNSGIGNMMASLMKKENGSSQRRLEKMALSPQEIAFLQIASSDKTYKQIAIEMQLTTRMIDTLRDGLFEKLDVKSRVGLAIYAIKNGIVRF